MLAITLTKEQIDDLKILLIQIKCIQANNNHEVFIKNGLYVLENRIMTHLNIKE